MAQHVEAVSRRVSRETSTGEIEAEHKSRAVTRSRVPETPPSPRDNGNDGAAIIGPPLSSRVYPAKLETSAYGVGCNVSAGVAVRYPTATLSFFGSRIVTLMQKKAKAPVNPPPGPSVFYQSLDSGSSKRNKLRVLRLQYKVTTGPELPPVRVPSGSYQANPDT